VLYCAASLACENPKTRNRPTKIIKRGEDYCCHCREKMTIGNGVPLKNSQTLATFADSEMFGYPLKVKDSIVTGPQDI
jgi:hypothetical protein